jgi:hypothetical protein
VANANRIGVLIMGNDGQRFTRPRFVETAAIAAGGFGTARLSAAVSSADVKIGLYSITYGGIWYRGDALTLEQVIERAKKFGYQGVEVDGKRPHGARYAQGPLPATS